jgi:light-regulated signal transduction histidine kinase (bacteriophytochrome)
MAELIDILLEYSRLETNQTKFRLINCNQIVEDVKERLKTAIATTEAEITYDSLPSIKADPILLIQLFQNLIDNAIKYRSQEKPKIHISAQFIEELNKKKWLFSFADNGIGIEENEQKQIFLLFKRLNENTTDKGSGIGLAICEKVVKYHGGTIWVESKKGEGSKFCFTIVDSNI